MRVLNGMMDRRTISTRSSTAGRVRGFTLLELLVTVSIIVVLLGILGTSLGQVRNATRSFVCKNNMRTLSFEFRMFADELTYANRGDSATRSANRFRLEDFQESIYGVDEFWDLGSEFRKPYKASKQPLICPAGPQELVKHANLPCRQGAVTPFRNVSIGFNMRLDRASVTIRSRSILQPVRLSSRILEYSSVPLLFDVDGEKSSASGLVPYYSAPAAGGTGKYAGNRLWFPSNRHNGETNVGFIGGHVLSSKTPEREAGWNWKYQPPVR